MEVGSDFWKSTEALDQCEVLKFIESGSTRSVGMAWLRGVAGAPIAIPLAGMHWQDRGEMSPRLGASPGFPVSCARGGDDQALLLAFSVQIKLGVNN